ncbi:hypothetical protein JCM5353_003856 [Sporobolomyces roseus]
MRPPFLSALSALSTDSDGQLLSAIIKGFNITSAALVAGVSALLLSLVLTSHTPSSSTLLFTPNPQYIQCTLSRLLAFFLTAIPNRFASTFTEPSNRTMASQILNTREEWRRELESLPSLEENDGKIPSVFLAHGQPMLLLPPHLAKDSPMLETLGEIQGPDGLLSQFLQDLGPALMEKYRPEAIVVLSAHFETDGGGRVSDYGEENPLLYDFFGFPDELYKIKFRSSGDSQLSRRVVELLQKAGNKESRLTPKMEARGRDGRGFDGPGLDHGVFVPFRLMFGEESPVPVVQVSIPSDLSPEAQRSLGEALEPLRSEGVLLIAGGLTIHTFRDFSAFSPSTAKPPYHSFESSLLSAFSHPSSTSYTKRSTALDSLTKHEAFRLAHPREEHFVPIYIAAGASRKAEEGERKGVKVVCGLWGAKTVVFGV